MNLKAFEAAITALAGVLDSVDARAVAIKLRLVASIFAHSKEKTAAATLKKLGGISLPPQSGAGELGRLAAFLRSVKAFADRIAGKAFATQLEALIAVLDGSASMSIDAFAEAAISVLTTPKSSGKAPPREEVVALYIERLVKRIDDESFIQPYRQLDQDKSVTSAERVEIGKRLTGKKPGSGPKALQAIWAHHVAMMTFRSKSESRAGRSAA